MSINTGYLGNSCTGIFNTCDNANRSEIRSSHMDQSLSRVVQFCLSIGPHNAVTSCSLQILANFAQHHGKLNAVIHYCIHNSYIYITIYLLAHAHMHYSLCVHFAEQAMYNNLAIVTPHCRMLVICT